MKKPIKCIAIDDEPLALEIIEAHVSKIDNLKLINKCSNALEALEFIKKEQPNIIFCDINMPEISGLEFAAAIKDKNILLVFTTAYSDYAVDAFALDALDYLLKPISLDRFKKAVERAEEYFDLKNQTIQPHSELAEGHMFVKADSRMVKINYEDIWYVEAFADYVKIYTSEDKRIVTLQTMKNMEQTLPSHLFARVHRSYIVAINKVLAVGIHDVKIGNKNIPLGKNYKDSFAEKIKMK
jgi:two-component system, LytTR family, response regulator